MNKKDRIHDSISHLHDYCINLESREVFLHSPIDSQEEDESGIDYRNSSMFIKNIKLLENMSKTQPIIVHANVVGGIWENSMAIFDIISLSTCPIISISYSHARSMSSIIPQAADLRVISPNALFMIHEGTIYVSDTSKGASSYIELNNKLSTIMFDIYLEKCKNGKFFKGKTDRYIKRFLKNRMDQKQEWYITAQESVDYGFMDGVLGTKGFETIDILKERLAE